MHFKIIPITNTSCGEQEHFKHYPSLLLSISHNFKKSIISMSIMTISIITMSIITMSTRWQQHYCWCSWPAMLAPQSHPLIQSLQLRFFLDSMLNIGDDWWIWWLVLLRYWFNHCDWGLSKILNINDTGDDWWHWLLVLLWYWFNHSDWGIFSIAC